ncbi:MAG TPA: hypothetical protein VI365_29700 [Trebonia sp.]
MEELERKLAEFRASTAEEIQQIKTTADAEVRQARATTQRDISAAQDEAARQVADADARTRPRRACGLAAGPAAARRARLTSIHLGQTDTAP